MGKTLANFSKHVNATTFADEFGGKVIDFSQVNLSVLM
jgi:nitrous oxide reductase accessory protein NosL